MKEFSLKWLLKLKKSELEEIQNELMELENLIDSKTRQISDGEVYIEKLQTNFKNSQYSYQIVNIAKHIKNTKETIASITKELLFLHKEKEMIHNRYLTKDGEVKILGKMEGEFKKKLVKAINLKAEKEISELVILSKGEV